MNSENRQTDRACLQRDRELLERIRHGEEREQERAWCELQGYYSQRILGQIRRFFGSRPHIDHEGLLQEVWLRTFRYLPERLEKSFAAWLTRTTLSVCYKELETLDRLSRQEETAHALAAQGPEQRHAPGAAPPEREQLRMLWVAALYLCDEHAHNACETQRRACLLIALLSMLQSRGLCEREEPYNLLTGLPDLLGRTSQNVSSKQRREQAFQELGQRLAEQSAYPEYRLEELVSRLEALYAMRTTDRHWHR